MGCGVVCIHQYYGFRLSFCDGIKIRVHSKFVLCSSLLALSKYSVKTKLVKSCVISLFFPFFVCVLTKSRAL